MFPAILIFALIALVLLLAACQGKSPNTTVTGTTPAPQTTPATPSPPLDRAELQARLESLARTEPPKDLKMGAMCYDTAGPPETLDHLCPTCGQRTIYGRKPSSAGGKDDLSVIWILENLPRCRALVAKLTAIRARLDESGLCTHCAAKDQPPVLALVVRIDSTRPEHRTAAITSEDLRILAGFLDGKVVDTGPQDRETPLRDHSARIAQLLGLTAPSLPKDAQP